MPPKGKASGAAVSAGPPFDVHKAPSSGRQALELTPGPLRRHPPPPPPAACCGVARLADPALPPCRTAQQPQDKSKQKAKEKLVEDKTFGLKNKGKSAKVQKYVQQLQKSAQPQRNPRLEEPSRKVGLLRCWEVAAR